jgi:hypothetical protein
MYEQGKMPEGDSDRIVAAEELIQLARQCETVKDAILASQGPMAVANQIPNWKAAEAVLMEANLLVGANESNGYAPAETTAKEDESDVKDLQYSSASTDEPVDQPVQEAPVEVPATLDTTHEGGDAHTTADHSQSVGHPNATGPQSVASAGASETREDAKKGEIWVDAGGEEWEILSYSGGPQADVMKVKTGEKTMVPAGMLKRKVRDTDVPAVGQTQTVPTDDRNDRGATPERLTTIADDTDLMTAAVVADIKSSVQDRYDQPESSIEAQFPSQTPDTSIPQQDSEDDEDYQRILEETETRYFPEGFPVPHQLEKPPAFIAIEDLVDVEDLPARTLHSQFNALAARAKLLYSVENARARDCARARKLSLRGPMREAREKLGSSSTLTERESWAEEHHPEVVTWSERVHKHSEEAKALEIYFDMYTENVSVLSRDWTMRDKERGS